MNDDRLKYYLVCFPGNLSSTQFDQFVNEKLSYCLKNRLDNVALDLSQIGELQRIHLNIINQWLRNLKSLGGSLALTGIKPKMVNLLQSSRIGDKCELFPAMEDLKEKYEITKVPDNTRESPAIGPDAQKIPENKDEEASEPKIQTEGSITGSINIRKLEQMDFSADVSQKLPFLNNGSDEMKAKKTKTLVAFSGEYQCLSCSEPEYFLKGYRFHACSNSNCKNKNEGWYPVLILF